jgi:thioredoxin 1
MYELKKNDNFIEFVSKYKFVVIDFFATWCGPCKKLGPELEEFLKSYDSTKVICLKVDVDIHEDVTSIHKVEALPTIVLYIDGKVSEHKFIGTSKKMFESLESILKKCEN